MKLLCVLPNNTIIKKGINDDAKVNVGSEYTLDFEIEYLGIVYYRLVGIPGAAFGSKCFATLPDTSADEMAEESREAIVNLETVLV